MPGWLICWTGCSKPSGFTEAASWLILYPGGIAGGCAVPGVMAAKDPAVPQGKTGHPADGSVHELRRQTARFRLVNRRLFPRPRGPDDVRHHSPGLLGALVAAKILRMTIIRESPRRSSWSSPLPYAHVSGLAPIPGSAPGNTLKKRGP